MSDPPEHHRTKSQIMNGINARADCWPTWQQELLLRAALLQDGSAIAAWERWKSTVDIEHLDGGSERLLPQLYRNLLHQGVTDPLLAHFKNAYLRTWRDNQVLFHRVSALLNSFHESGIETIVLKGAALALLHYRDAGLRPMSDLDVMVHSSQRATAIEAMRTVGWRPMPRFPELLSEGYLSIVNSHGFTDDNGRECDLHWHLFPECCHTDDDDDFWHQAVPFQIHGQATRALAPADQLLHVCIHGAEWNSIPPIRWVADSIAIMKSSSIDWDRIVGQARKRQLMLPLKATMNYLAEEFAAPVPAEVLRSLRNATISKMELAEYKYKIQNFEQRPLGFLPLLWFRYLRLEGSQHAAFRIFGFVHYLQCFWGVDSIRQLPTYGARMAIRRARIVILGFTNRFSRMWPMKRSLTTG